MVFEKRQHPTRNHYFVIARRLKDLESSEILCAAKCEMLNHRFTDTFFFLFVVQSARCGKV